MATITVGPGPVNDWFRDLIEPSGLQVVDQADDAEALVWLDPRGAEALGQTLDGNPQVRWVQLPSAGIEHMVEAELISAGDRVWTAMQGAYAEPVAEHALALLLAGLRNLDEWAGATSWGKPAGRPLFGAKVTILGAGGIAQALLRLLQPFRVEATLVRRQAEPGASGADPVNGLDGHGLDGHDAHGLDGLDGHGLDGLNTGAGADPPAPHRILGTAELHSALADADAVILALALTPQTRGIIAAAELDVMAEHAWLVNVARGAHIVTDDLVDALNNGSIGGAGLDVTDPEPLPDGHPLWTAPHCIITPHSANPLHMAIPYFAARIAENARRFATGEELVGVVDPEHGY